MLKSESGHRLMGRREGKQFKIHFNLFDYITSLLHLVA